MQREKVSRISYLVFVGTLLTVACFKMATPFLAVLFSYFALEQFRFFQKKTIAILLFLIFVASIFYGFVTFVRETIAILPRVAETAIPTAINYSMRWGIELPFSDLNSLKGYVVDALQTQLNYFAKFAEIATKEFVFLVIGIVVAIGLFINSSLDLNEGNYTISNNFYSLLCKDISKRFASLYKSFVTVMGAQIIISTINTFFTAIFVLFVGLPYIKIIVIITFLCGLLPVVGNLLSNTIICGIAITKSPYIGVISLVYLISIHKLEYFLNSKIIGGRIKNPMWLTLLSLIAGECTLGVPGMIFAPILLYYIKQECSQIEVKI